MASLRDVAAKSPGKKRTPKKTPTKSPARASASSTTKLLLSASKRTPTSMSLTGRVDSSKKTMSAGRRQEVVEEAAEEIQEAEQVNTEQAPAAEETPSRPDIESLLAPTPPQPKPFLFDTTTNYNPRRQTLSAPIVAAESATKASTNNTTTTPVSAAAALAKANARRHTLSVRKLDEQKKLLQEKAAAAVAAASSSTTAATPKALVAALVTTPAPTETSNFEAASEIDEELPTLGGEDISVIEMAPSTHKKKKGKDKKRVSSRKSSVAAMDSKKSRMSIGAMIRRDTGGDHYLHEALLAECRRCEADADVVELLEENRLLRIKMIETEVEDWKIKDDLKAAVDDGMKHIAMRAVEHSDAMESMADKHKGEMSVVKEALDSERSARQNCMKQLENLKKKFGVVDEPVEEDEDTESEAESDEEEEEEMVKEAVVAVKKAQQKKAGRPRKATGAKEGVRGKGKRAYKYDNWDDSNEETEEDESGSSEESSGNSSDEESVQEAELESSYELDVSTESNKGRKRKSGTGNNVKAMKPKVKKAKK